MAGAKNRSGGPRDGSGRKTDKEIQDLRACLDEAIPREKRVAILTRLGELAEVGKIDAIKLVLAYSFGTPPSGDDLLIQEGVNKIASDFYSRLTPIYGEQKAREIIGHLGADPARVGARPGGA